MVTARRISSSGGTFSPPVAGMPSSWNATKYAGNPVINVDDNPNETDEQYVPAPIRLLNGDIWVYPKGTSRIYAWKSTDGGVTFTLQNGNNAVLAPVASTWMSDFVLEAHAIYDESSGTIHLWAKGRASGANTWAWGHWTADDDDPTSFSADAANPILTSATVSTALGGGTVSDLGISCVLVIGSTFHFYGYAQHSSTYKLIQATGTTWNDPTGVESILSAPGTDVLTTPSVVRMPGVGAPVYAMLYTAGQAGSSGPRSIKSGTSADGETWDFSDTTDVLSPTTGWEDIQVYAGQFLRSTASPYDRPYIDSQGRWIYYYSGSAGGDDNTGLAYFEPD